MKSRSRLVVPLSAERWKNVAMAALPLPVDGVRPDGVWVAPHRAQASSCGCLQSMCPTAKTRYRQPVAPAVAGYCPRAPALHWLADWQIVASIFVSANYFFFDNNQLIVLLVSVSLCCRRYLHARGSWSNILGEFQLFFLFFMFSWILFFCLRRLLLVAVSLAVLLIFTGFLAICRLLLNSCSVVLLIYTTLSIVSILLAFGAVFFSVIILLQCALHTSSNSWLAVVVVVTFI